MAPCAWSTSISARLNGSALTRLTNILPGCLLGKSASHLRFVLQPYYRRVAPCNKVLNFLMKIPTKTALFHPVL
jgi:hypothetical protein